MLPKQLSNNGVSLATKENFSNSRSEAASSSVGFFFCLDKYCRSVLIAELITWGSFRKGHKMSNVRKNPQITLFSERNGQITLWSSSNKFLCDNEDQVRLLKISGVYEVNLSRGPGGLSVTIFHDQTERNDVLSQVKIWAQTMGRVIVQKK